MKCKIKETIVLFLIISLVLGSCGVHKQNKCGCPPRRGIVG